MIRRWHYRQMLSEIEGEEGPSNKYENIHSSISRRASSTKKSIRDLGDTVFPQSKNMERMYNEREEMPVAPSRPSKLRTRASKELDEVGPSHVTTPASEGNVSVWSQNMEKIENVLNRNYYTIAYALVVTFYMIGFGEYMYFRLTSILAPHQLDFRNPCKGKTDQRIGKEGFHYGVSIGAFIAVAIFQLLCFFGLTIAPKWIVCHENPRDSRDAAKRVATATSLRTLVAEFIYRVFLCYGICGVIICAIIFYMVGIQDSLGDLVSTILQYTFDAVILMYFISFPAITIIYHPNIHCFRNSTPARFRFPSSDPETRTTTLESTTSGDALTTEEAPTFSRNDRTRQKIDPKRVDCVSPVLEEYLQSPRRHIAMQDLKRPSESPPLGPRPGGSMIKVPSSGCVSQSSNSRITTIV